MKEFFVILGCILKENVKNIVKTFYQGPHVLHLGLGKEIRRQQG